MNSRNSSKPPSSNGYAKPAAKSRRTRSGKKPGKQLGSPGCHLARRPDPDATKVYPPSTCENCGNDLDDAREAAELVKAELARAIGAEPAVVRRLFSAGHVNPTLDTLAGVSAVLGLRVTLEPLTEADRERVTNLSLKGGVRTRGLWQNMSPRCERANGRWR